jgi:hypothetical protein
MLDLHLHPQHQPLGLGLGLNEPDTSRVPEERALQLGVEHREPLALAALRPEELPSATASMQPVDLSELARQLAVASAVLDAQYSELDGQRQASG